MLRISSRILLSIVLIPTLAGCRYDRSFMQMDSNSGIPFLGLQLAVDSGSRPRDPAELKKSDENSAFNLNFDSQNGHHSLFESDSDDDTRPGTSRIVRVKVNR